MKEIQGSVSGSNSTRTASQVENPETNIRDELAQYLSSAIQTQRKEGSEYSFRAEIAGTDYQLTVKRARAAYIFNIKEQNNPKISAVKVFSFDNIIDSELTKQLLKDSLTELNRKKARLMSTSR